MKNSLGQVWFSESTNERKKKVLRKMIFVIFGCPMKNIKENQI